LENPDAIEFKKEMKSESEKYPNLSLDDLLTLVKAKKPTESKSSKDFSSKSSNTKARKKITDLTEEEATKLS
jgi:hypothetical protein